MAIERHEGAKPEDTFHTIQGLLDCGHCNGIIANFGPHQSLDDDGDEIVVCPSCGSEFLPEELADARVEEMLEKLNAKVPANCVFIGESRMLLLEEKEEKYDKLLEERDRLRVILERLSFLVPPETRDAGSLDIESITATANEARSALGEE